MPSNIFCIIQQWRPDGYLSKQTAVAMGRYQTAVLLAFVDSRTSDVDYDAEDMLDIQYQIPESLRFFMQAMVTYRCHFL